MTHRTDEHCCAEWRETYKFCPVHTLHNTPSSDWEREILSKYFVSRLGGDHVGAQDELIADIHTHIEKARREERERLVMLLDGADVRVTRTGSDSDEMYLKVKTVWDIIWPEMKEKIIKALTNKES